MPRQRVGIFVHDGSHVVALHWEGAVAPARVGDVAVDAGCDVVDQFTHGVPLSTPVGFRNLLPGAEAGL
ncbi:hypothetical protein ACFPRL_01425 [Pseudoclavibacter helvolus]